MNTYTPNNLANHLPVGRTPELATHNREAGAIGFAFLGFVFGSVRRHPIVSLAAVGALTGAAIGVGASIHRPSISAAYETAGSAVETETKLITWGNTSDLRVATAQFEQTLDAKDVTIAIDTKPAYILGKPVPVPDPFPDTKITREQHGFGTLNIFVPLRDDEKTAVKQTVLDGKIYIVVDRSKVQTDVTWNAGYPAYRNFQFNDKGEKNYTDTADFGKTILDLAAAVPSLIGRDDLKNIIDQLMQGINTAMNVKGLNEFKKECMPQLSTKTDEAIKKGVIAAAKALGRDGSITSIDFTNNAYPWEVPVAKAPEAIESGSLSIPVPNLDGAEVRQKSVCDTGAIQPTGAKP